MTVLLWDPTHLHLAGLSKNQMIRGFGFTLFLLGAALFVSVCRRQRHSRGAPARHGSREPSIGYGSREPLTGYGSREPSTGYESRPWPIPGPVYSQQPAREYPVLRPRGNPRRYDWHRTDELPQVVHRPKQPDLRDRVRGA